MAVADEFNMSSLTSRLLRSKNLYGGLQTTTHGPVLRVAMRASVSNSPEAFIFPYGCIVVWGTHVDRDGFLSLVAEDALRPTAKHAALSMEYEVAERRTLRREGITRGSAERNNSEKEGLDPMLERLAISWGLAQSIKLAAFESATRATLENTRHLAEELAHAGEISVSKKEISRLMGRLFLDRYRYHLTGELLMIPAFFWDHEEYLPSYRHVEIYYEVNRRGEILNKRVQVMQELYHLLNEELGHQSTTALEFAITIMIAFEILLALMTLAKESIRTMFSACALFFGLVAFGWTLWRIYQKYRSSKSASRFQRGQFGTLI